MRRLPTVADLQYADVWREGFGKVTEIGMVIIAKIVLLCQTYTAFLTATPQARIRLACPSQRRFALLRPRGQFRQSLPKGFPTAIGPPTLQLKRNRVACSCRIWSLVLVRTKLVKALARSSAKIIKMMKFDIGELLQ